MKTHHHDHRARRRALRSCARDHQRRHTLRARDRIIVTTNQVGMSVRFSRLVARHGMNCPSARYVLNHRIRAKWART